MVRLRVKDILERLRDYHPEDLVIIASDAEGNRLLNVEEIGPHYYRPINEYSGVLIEVEDEDDEYNPEYDFPCVVFWPGG